MTEKENGFGAYKKKADKDLSETKRYLQKINDQQDKILIEAREELDYDIANNRGKFAKDLGEKFEDHIRKLYGIGKDAKVDKRSFEALVKKHLGVTKKEIKRIVMNNQTEQGIYKNLGQEMTDARSRFTQEHYYGISHDYITLEDPETIKHAIKYMNLDKHASFDADAAKGNIDHLKRLFIRHGLEGIVEEQHIPVELKKEVKNEKKKKKSLPNTS